QVMYKSAMAMAGVDDVDECIAVGDSLHHDIKGANVAGVRSVFISNGIHAAELGISEFGEAASDSCVSSLASSCGAYPSYVLSSFTW
ncbi:hypothetical protein M569_13787, partial [Genlisea aurea]